MNRFFIKVERKLSNDDSYLLWINLSDLSCILLTLLLHPFAINNDIFKKEIWQMLIKT